MTWSSRRLRGLPPTAEWPRPRSGARARRSDHTGASSTCRRRGWRPPAGRAAGGGAGPTSSSTRRTSSGSPGATRSPRTARISPCRSRRKDRAEPLRRCLDSLAALRYRSFDVLVIDNAPRSGDTRAVVRRLGAGPSVDRVRYLQEPVPGAARALQPRARGRRGRVGGAHRRRRGRRPAVARRDRRGGHVGARRRVRHRADPARRDRHARRRSCWSSSAATRVASGRRRVDLGEHRPADPLFPFTTGRLGSGANIAFDAARLRARGGFDTALGPGTPRARRRGPARRLRRAHRRRWRRLRAERARVALEPARSTRACAGSCTTTASGWRPTSPPRPCGSPGSRSARPGTWRRACGTSSGARRPRTSAKRRDYPKDLERRELLGMIAGPAAYLAGRWSRRGEPPGGRAAPSAAPR